MPYLALTPGEDQPWETRQTQHSLAQHSVSQNGGTEVSSLILKVAAACYIRKQKLS